MVYYESRKGELKKRRKNEDRCDERLKTKSRGNYIPHMHWVARGTGTPKDKDEVNKRSLRM